MTLQVFVTNNVSASEFITFWSEQYDYPLQHLYTNNINKKSFELTDISELFEWKNGMRLSGKKEKSLSTILENIEIIRQLKHEFNQTDFDNYFGEISAIWRIFLLHIIAPNRFPIFDQHVYRAYRFIEGLSDEAMPDKTSDKLKIYHNEYLPFYKKMRQAASDLTEKKIDEALWAFGKLLSLYPKLLQRNTAQQRLTLSDFSFAKSRKATENYHGSFSNAVIEERQRD